MNALIQYPPEGADVRITQSTFEYFSTCGSVINNQYRIPFDNGQRAFQSSGGGGWGGNPSASTDTFYSQISNFEYKHAYPISLQEIQFAYNNSNGTYLNPYKTSSSCSNSQGINDCHKITISSSTFQYFDIFFSSDPFSQSLLKSNAQQRPVLKYKGLTPHGQYDFYDQYRAPLFLLYKYPGTVTITANSFKEVRYPARTCYQQNYESDIQDNSVSPFFLHKSIQGVKTEMPIVITQASRSIIFTENTINYVSGSKGFLLVTRNNLATDPVVIYSNTFSHVSGFSYSGVLNLRTNYTSSSRTVSSDFCAGFHVASNTFSNSVVCAVPDSHTYYKSAGLIKVSCHVDETDFLTDQIYEDPTSWWQIDNALDVTPSPMTIALGSQAIEVDTKITTIKDNTFTNNLRGIRSSLILSLQLPYIRISGNSYSANGDVILQLLISSNLTNSYGGFSGSYPIVKQQSYGGSSNTNALIQILGGYGFSVSGDTIGQGNWKEDMLNTVYSSYIYSKRVRGQLLIQSMTVTTPPLSICSGDVEAQVQQLDLFNQQCQGTGSYPAQTREPFIKIQQYNDVSYSPPNGQDFQTTLNLRDLHLSNLVNGHNTRAFYHMFEGSPSKSNKIVVSNVTLASLYQSTQSILDLRGLNADISWFTLLDVGNSTASADYIIRIADQNQLSNSLSFSLSNISFTRTYAGKSLIEISNAGTSQTLAIAINSTTIIDSQVQQYILQVQNDNAQVTLDTWGVTNSKIQGLSTLTNYEFYVSNSKSFIMNNFTHTCTLSRSHCRVLRYYQSAKQLTISNSTFKMDQNSQGYVISTNQKSVPFDVRASTLTMSSNSFSGYTSVSTQGGVFKTLVSTITDENSNYFSNTGVTGGVFYFEGVGTITLTSCNFYQNTATNAGAIQLAETVRLTTDGCKFYQNSATASGGVLRTQQGATFYIKNSQFYQNTATSDSSVIYSFSNQASISSRIQNSFIYKNRMPHGKNTVIVLYSQLVIDNVEFYQNLALEGSHGIYTAYAYLTIQNSRCYTKDTNNFQFQFDSSQTTSSVEATSVCLTASEDASVTIRNSTFANARDNSGSIAIVGSVNLKIQNCTFTDNEASTGAALYVTDFYELSISECVFSDNMAWESGSDIYVENSNRAFTVEKSNFTNTRVSSIFVADADLSLIECIFNTQIYEQYFNDDQQYTLICDNCGGLNVLNSQFLNLEVDGVIGAKNTSMRFSYDQLENTKAYINGNTFQNIRYHTDGGGIRINNFDAVLIQGNTFKNIKQISQEAQLKGAAIYQSGSYSINVRVASNTFQNNQANVGGAIAYEFYRPQIENSNTFTGNTASKYGTDIAGYATRLAFVSEQTARQLISYSFDSSYVDYGVNSISLQNTFQISGHQSGGTAPNFYIAILDRYGQIVKTKNDEKLTISMKVINTSIYAPVATTSVDIRSNNGIFNVTGVTLIAEPDTTVTIQLTADTVFSTSLPDVIEFQTTNGGNLILSTSVNFRACIEGEAFLDNGECSACTSDTSYLLTIASSPTNCLNCPNNANCFGGSEIGPKTGYWRSSKLSVNFMTCFLGAACLGRQSVDDDPLGNCADGYRGMFCAQCEQGYTRSSNFNCAKCPEQWKNVLLLVGVFLIALILIVLLVKSTLNAVHSQKSPFAIYIKVMINHLQLIFLTSSFDLSWPDQVNAFYEQTEPVANVSDKVVSLDCFLDGTTSTVIGRFYLYLLTYLLIPFLVTVASLCFWWLKIRNNKKRICSRSIATIIILLFLLHPTITNTMFQTFLCRDVDGTLRLVQELDQTCWQGKHLWWALLGGFPGLICWALGIPAFAWIMLKQHKKRLHNLEVKEKYGFLYKGYKVDSFYWQCVIMYRKVAMIFISVFLNGIGTMIQALVVMVLLVFFIIITQRYKPYYSRQLNDLEIISLVTSCITFYCGLFFLSSKAPSDPSFEANRDFYLSSEAKWVFFFVIVLANMLFLFMWIFKFLGEVREMFRKKCTTLYVCFCLCCRRGLLVEDIKNARQNTVRQLLIETIEQLQRYFRSLRHMYIRRKNFVDKQKFQKMVHNVHLQFQKLNTNKVLLDQEVQQPAYKGNVRMHAAFDDNFSKQNYALKEQVDNQEISKITFSINDRDASIFVIQQDDVSEIKRKTEPQIKMIDTQARIVKKNKDIEQPEHIDRLNMLSPESEPPTMTMDAIRISDRRKQLLMSQSRSFQHSSDYDERTHLKIQKQDSDESKEKSQTEELKVDMNEMLQESSPDQIIVLSDVRQNIPLEQPEEENYTKKKNSGYIKLRKSQFQNEIDVPMFDEGIFDVDARRNRIQTQKIIKVNPEDLLRGSQEYGVEFETNNINKKKNKIKIQVQTARGKEFHNKVRNTMKREQSQPSQEQNELNKSDLNNFVDELKQIEEPQEKNEREPNTEVISEADFSVQSTRMGFPSTRNVNNLQRQNTIERMESAFKNKNYEGNEF